MKFGGTVYMMTNQYNTVIYTGVTSDIVQRVWQHKHSFFDNSFTSRYRCFKLVYFNNFVSIEEAIREEKRIKGGNRAAKEKLIHDMNPSWKDLSDGWW